MQSSDVIKIDMFKIVMIKKDGRQNRCARPFFINTYVPIRAD